MSRIVGVLILVVAVGGIALAVAMQPGVPVDVAVAERRSITRYVEERGRTRLPDVTRITMPIDGRVLPISLEEGDRVRKGDVVARLDVSDLETAVARGEARMRQFEARIEEHVDDRLEQNAIKQFDEFLVAMANTIDAAVKQIEASQKRADVTNRELERRRRLLAAGSVTEKDFYEAQLSQVEAAVDLAKDALTRRSMESIRTAMQIARLSIQQYVDKKDLGRTVLEWEQKEAYHTLERAKRDRGRAEVLTDVAGVVLHREVSNERVLGAGHLLLEIGDLSTLEVEAEILSQEVVDVKPGQRVEITIPAANLESVPGRVKRVRPRGFRKVSSLGVEQQRVLVVFEFEDGVLDGLAESGTELGVDYRVRVRVHVDRREDTVVVPRSALFRSAAGRWQAFVVEDDRVRRVDVEVGLMNDREAEITAGIDPAATVVLAPESTLEDGTHVEPQPLP